MTKKLIVYYSLTNGNTKGIAEQLQAATGADIDNWVNKVKVL